MKALAILKDSLREAWDSKTLLVMLIMAAIFLVGIASIGYEAATPRTVFDSDFKGLSRPVARVDKGLGGIELKSKDGGRIPYPVYEITTFRTIKEGSHESQGEHEFTILIRSSEKKESKDGKENADAKSAAAAPIGETFDKLVALWHSKATDRAVVPSDPGSLNDPRSWILLKPVTIEMVREFFAVELERSTQVPITAFEQLPAEDPSERVYKITTGPSSETRVWPVKFSILFGAWQMPIPLPLGILLFIIQDVLISKIGGLIIILIAVIITSFFIPNMLRPGSVVMLLSKPISRTMLLLCKYFGGLFFVLILTSFTVGGIWLITGIRAGVWAPGIFAVVPLLTLTFAILYAVSTLAAVVTRNSIVAILVTLVFGGFLWLVGKVEGYAASERIEADAEAQLQGKEAQYEPYMNVSAGINSALPRWHDIDTLTAQVVIESLMTLKQQETQGVSMKKHLPSWGGTLGVTGLWIAALLAFSCWWFSRKDF